MGVSTDRESSLRYQNELIDAKEFGSALGLVVYHDIELSVLVRNKKKWLDEYEGRDEQDQDHGLLLAIFRSLVDQLEDASQSLSKARSYLHECRRTGREKDRPHCFNCGSPRSNFKELKCVEGCKVGGEE
jgi:hypothetical protein